MSEMFRSKRSRYASRACKECQRRKVRCDGQKPCARCAAHLVSCDYAAMGPRLAAGRSSSTVETVPDPISRTMPPRGNSEQSATIASRSSRAPPDFTTHAPEFSGPSSTEYAFNAVNGNLRAMGMQSAIPDKHSESRVPATSSGRLAQYGPFMRLLTMDPLWDMTREDAYMLIDDWCDGLGALYPIVSRKSMKDTAKRVFDSLHLAHSEGLRERGGSVAEALLNHDTNKLKIVIAIGMTKAAGGRDHQAQRLFQSTSEAVEGLIWNPEGIHGIQLLYLVAMYHYHLNEEVRTGRCIAFAARLCLEAGLHRRVMLDKLFPDAAECVDALQSFWAVYMFERRLSLGQGIPFSIQDSYIDRSLYTIDIANPLLPALLDWTTLAGKAWHALNNQTEKTHEARVDDINYLDFQILAWYDALPDYLRLPGNPAWTHDAHEQPTYFHSVIFVRKAHLRNLIHRPVLQSPAQSRQNEPILLKAIEISMETIRTLFHLNEHTPLVRTHPMFFQQLLLTAFGNLLLALVGTGPAIRNRSREEFDMFLTLFHQLSSECAALGRTWQRLQGLRDLHAKLSHSDHGTRASSIDYHYITGRDSTAVPLSFDDVFPDMQMHVMPIDTSSRHEHPTADTGDFLDFGFAPEDFLEARNLFDFPFLDLL
ncbi:hypothetical protein CC86DRAFT_154613 [Ophiobolus disseminans]|uniref:Zn(2)-C6 fungal-type domain-containing protein n=1 Tax=Ophiobolus disseminans TaxID=1469910 RepID=A0A6A6ZCP3_9PLEO|nr:hypothetical protein CC86DRAFT_154613 [Ophiobolus disseminans]